MEAVDMQDNLLAFTLAIVSEKFMLPEQCWQKLENPNKEKFNLPEEDVKDIFKLRESGVSNIEVASIYGVCPTWTSRQFREYKRSGKKWKIAGK